MAFAQLINTCMVDGEVSILVQMFLSYPRQMLTCDASAKARAVVMMRLLNTCRASGET